MRLNWSSRRVLTAYLTLFDVTIDPMKDFYSAITMLIETYPDEKPHIDVLLELLICEDENCEGCISTRRSRLREITPVQMFLAGACERRYRHRGGSSEKLYVQECLEKIYRVFDSMDEFDDTDHVVCNDT